MVLKQTAISTSKAPPPLPQFSQAVAYNGLLFCSGSVGMDPVSKKMVEGTVKDRARQALRNLQNVLEAGGSSLDRVLKVNVFLSDMKNFGLLNEAWDEVFTQEPKPTRTCVAAYQLPLGTDVEIELIGAISDKSQAKL